MKGILSIRNTLWWFVFLGFAVNYMMRINLNITIVSMVQRKQIKLSTGNKSNFTVETSSSNESIYHNEATFEEYNKFEWDEFEQNLILGAFFWLHWLSQIPGGVLAQRYGTKIIFGLSNLFMCLISLFIPLSAKLDYRALISLRVLQGLVGGLAWPSMHTLTANWIPPNERSRFVTAYTGGSIGVSLTYVLCGFLIEWINWQSVFYATSSIGIIWFIFWWILVYNTPEEHPQISKMEKIRIAHNLGKDGTRSKLPIPWMKILTSYPMWINIIVQWGNIWSIFTFMTQAPTYFKIIQGWDVYMTGVWSGIPHLCRVLFTYIIATITDVLLNKRCMSRTNVRKLAVCLGCLGQGMLYLGLAFTGNNQLLAIIYVTAIIMLSGSASTGTLASFIDMSPNFASIMLGVCNTVCTTPGFISPVIVGALTNNNQTASQWQLIFLISAVLLLSAGLLHMFCSTSELQKWNFPDGPKQQVEEMQLMPRIPLKE